MINKPLWTYTTWFFNKKFLLAQAFSFYRRKVLTMRSLRTETQLNSYLGSILSGAYVLELLQVTFASVLHNQKAQVNYGNKAEKLYLWRNKHNVRANNRQQGLVKMHKGQTYQILIVSNCSSRITMYTCGGTAANTQSLQSYTHVHGVARAECQGQVSGL